MGCTLLLECHFLSLSQTLSPLKSPGMGFLATRCCDNSSHHTVTLNILLELYHTPPLPPSLVMGTKYMTCFP